MPIKQRQVVVVHRQLAAGGGGIEEEFSFNLGLDFVPTSVIVRTIAYRLNSATGLHAIRTSWIKSKDNNLGLFICSANNDFVSNPNTTFKISNPGSLINGDTKFSIKKLTDAEIDPTADGALGLTLEFIQEDYPEPSPLVNEMKQLINVLSNVNKPRDVYPFDNIDRTKSQPAPIEQPKPVNEPEEMEGEGDDTSQDKKKNNPLTEM
jgi:hypothetical protein